MHFGLVEVEIDGGKFSIKVFESLERMSKKFHYLSEVLMVFGRLANARK